MSIKELLLAYKDSIKRIPILKFTPTLIAVVCILAIIAYAKLRTVDVILYSLPILFLAVLTFLLSYIIKESKKGYVKFLVRFLITCLSFVIAVIILSFASFIFFEKPSIYKRWFTEVKVQDTARNNPKITIIDTEKAKDDIKRGLNVKKSSKTEKYNPKPKNETSLPHITTYSIQLPQETGGYYRIYLDKELVSPSLQSTLFNPRLEIDVNSMQGNLLIITKRGDSCSLHLPKILSQPLYRIVPNCF